MELVLNIYLWPILPSPGNNSILTKWALYLWNATYLYRYTGVHISVYIDVSEISIYCKVNTIILPGLAVKNATCKAWRHCRLSWKSYNVHIWEFRFTLGLTAAKNTHPQKRQIKVVWNWILYKTSSLAGRLWRPLSRYQARCQVCFDYGTFGLEKNGLMKISVPHLWVLAKGVLHVAKWRTNTKRWKCKTDNTVEIYARYDRVVFFYIFPRVFGWKFFNIVQ